jgi:hypothetical protein
MFQVIPEPEFSAWYEALPEPIAEEVTTAIDLAASAEGLLAPERLSRLLLWFDGTGSGVDLAGLEGPIAKGHPALQLSQARSYLMWHQEVVLCLQSQAFQERLGQLEPARAAQALSLVERLQKKLQAARLSTGLGAWRTGARPDESSGVRAVFLDLMSSMGLEPQLVLGSGSGLRELAITNIEPQLRVLFGLDFPARRLIAILGEQLDRSYYGDAVKRAEQRWQQYCQRQAERLERAP